MHWQQRAAITGKGNAQMALEFVDGTLFFGNTTGMVAETSQISTFSGTVEKVITAVMRGYDFGFEGTDRPIHEIQAQVTGASVIDILNPSNKVQVFGLLLLRDFSGNIDDPYHGIIDYTVIAEVCAPAVNFPED
jgi:hypothetical protein